MPAFARRFGRVGSEGRALSIALLLVIGCGHAAPPIPSAQAAMAQERDRILAPLALDPAVRVRSDEVVYAVHGDTPAAARAQMNEERPVGTHGPFDALTKWFVSWHYPHLIDSRGCRAGEPHIDVTITTTLPRWDEGELSHRWQSYFAGLRVHESGHAQNARAAGQAVLETLKKLPPAGSCSELDDEASREGKELLRSFNAEDDAYDQRTRNGQSQGATFP